MEYKKFPGKENEANQALEKFVNCQSKFSNLLNAINHDLDVSMGIVSKSTDYCIEECETKFSDEEGLKSCFRNCFEHSFKYYVKTTQEFLIQEMDLAIKELNKI
jgi:hypothetical protein